MYIRDVWIRFYKSFNFDYELKAHPRSEEKSWQLTADGWMPHVRVPLESDITAVVGANESGKSHLLDAIRIILTGEGLLQRDFCRYSSLFSVERGKRLYPEIGATFGLSDDERAGLAEVGVPLRGNGDLLMLRPAPDAIEVLDSNDVRTRLSSGQRTLVENLLPHAFVLDTRIDLPDSVSIAALAQGVKTIPTRQRRSEIISSLRDAGNAEAFAHKAQALFTALSIEDRTEDPQQRLGRLLLTKIARIDESSFAELQDAIRDEREGLVNGLIQEMNKSISRHLNISKWWTQDADFQLRVSPREHELVFTIRDRTGTDYSFSERSRGLTFFLSYFVQLRSHDLPDERPEVLLMDEPDAYLSAVGQQDLLRILEDHARPEGTDREDQVVYVTHSPFLINRNAARRVRVVDKGTRDEGTRLVRDAAQNHYEPLRTSLGVAVAESAFIGGDNLFIEGISDQIYLTSMNTRAIRSGVPLSKRLNLNEVTLVPGGSNVPYMLYLARGRDRIKPACAVLLDSDAAGLEAQAQIKRGGAKGRPTVSDDLVVMIGTWATAAGVVAAPDVSIKEPEDLVPLSLACAAARRYASAVLGLSEEEVSVLTPDSIGFEISNQEGSLWDAVEVVFRREFDTGIGKAGFAKELIALVEAQGDDSEFGTDIATLDANFTSLLSRIAEALRAAREREEDTRRDQRVERIIDAFTADHPTSALRDDVSLMLNRIDAAADDNSAGDVIKTITGRLRRVYDLQEAPMSRVVDYPNFMKELHELPAQVTLVERRFITEIADISSKPRPTKVNHASTAIPASAGGPSTPHAEVGIDADQGAADELAADIAPDTTTAIDSEEAESEITDGDELDGAAEVADGSSPGTA